MISVPAFNSRAAGVDLQERLFLSLYLLSITAIVPMMPELEATSNTKGPSALRHAAYTNNSNSGDEARSQDSRPASFEVAKRKAPKRKLRIGWKFRKYITILYKVTLYLLDSLC
jgi:hypothetical protein